MFKGISTTITDEEACYGPVLLKKNISGDKAVAEYFDHLNEVFEIRQRSNPTVKAALEERKKNAGQ